MKTLSKPLIIAVVTATVSTIAVGSAFAHGKFKRDNVAERISDRLELTDTQETALNDMMDEMRTYRRDTRAATEKQIYDLITTPELTSEQALQLLQLRRQQREAQQQWLAEQLAEFHATLNSAQREEAAEMMTALLTRGGGKHRRHGDNDDDDDYKHRRHHGFHSWGW